jgi:hypothetical protein
MVRLYSMALPLGRHTLVVVAPAVLLTAAGLRHVPSNLVPPISAAHHSVNYNRRP